MQQGIAKFKHGPPFFANLTIIANYICGISKAHFRLVFLALHGAYAFKARVFSEKNRALFFLDRHPMAVSRFHPGRFVTFFGEAITLFFYKKDIF